MTTPPRLVVPSSPSFPPPVIIPNNNYVNGSGSGSNNSSPTHFPHPIRIPVPTDSPTSSISSSSPTYSPSSASPSSYSPTPLSPTALFNELQSPVGSLPIISHGHAHPFPFPSLDDIPNDKINYNHGNPNKTNNHFTPNLSIGNHNSSLPLPDDIIVTDVGDDDGDSSFSPFSPKSNAAAGVSLVMTKPKQKFSFSSVSIQSNPMAMSHNITQQNPSSPIHSVSMPININNPSALSSSFPSKISDSPPSHFRVSSYSPTLIRTHTKRFSIALPDPLHLPSHPSKIFGATEIFPLVSSCPAMADFPKSVTQLISDYSSSILSRVVLSRKGMLMDIFSGNEISRMPSTATDECSGYTGFTKFSVANVNDREVMIVATNVTVYFCLLQTSPTYSLKVMAHWRFHSRYEEENLCKSVAICSISVLPGAICSFLSQCGHVRTMPLLSILSAFDKVQQEISLRIHDVHQNFDPIYFRGFGNIGVLTHIHYVCPNILVAFDCVDRVHNDMVINVYSLMTTDKLYSYSLDCNRNGEIFIPKRAEHILPEQNDHRGIRIRQWLEELYSAIRLCVISHQRRSKTTFHMINEKNVISIDEDFYCVLSLETKEIKWNLFENLSFRNESEENKRDLQEINNPQVVRSYGGSSISGDDFIVVVTIERQKSELENWPQPTVQKTSMAFKRNSLSMGEGDKEKDKDKEKGAPMALIQSTIEKMKNSGDKDKSKDKKDEKEKDKEKDDKSPPSPSQSPQLPPGNIILYVFNVYSRELLHRWNTGEKSGAMPNWIAQCDS